MSYLDRIPSIGITKEEWERWTKTNNRPYTDPYRERHTVGSSKGQSEFEIRAKIPRGKSGGKKKEQTNA